MITIWTDGACSVHTDQSGGWGVVVSNGVELGGYIPSCTNNRAELTAMMKALEWCVDNNEVATIYSDSTYVVNGLTKWAKKWSKNDWKKQIANKDIFMVLYPLYLKSGCTLEWCRGHSGIEGNERADKIAVMCREEKKEYESPR